MAKSAAAKKVTPPAAVSIGSLAEIVAAGADGMFTSVDVHAPLLESGHVEINSDITNAHGHIATRATEKGIFALNTNSAHVAVDTPTTTSTPTKPVFVIEYGIEPAKAARSGSGGKTEVYPFADLPPPNEHGQKASFFVPGKTMKAMSSTISGATRRYAVPKDPAEMTTNRKGEPIPVLVQTRKFHGEDSTKNGVSGVRVFRDA